jgi:hypothetical protein
MDSAEIPLSVRPSDTVAQLKSRLQEVSSDD